MSALLAWVLTYLVHSTALLGGAVLLRLALRERRLALQEAVLRAALVGGFVTASLQVGFDVRPWGGSLRVHDATRAADAILPPPESATFEAEAAPPLAADLPAGVAYAPPSRAGEPRPAAAMWWRPLLLGAWGCLASIGLVRLGIATSRLRRLLAGRRFVESGPWPVRLASLAAAAGLRQPVRLSATSRLSVPLATGFRRPEVCLPERALTDVDGDALIALCAHEVAHIARRDPAWILVARLAPSLVPLQPLNVWAARRLRDLAECLADDLAVAASARPLGLARSLVDVAAWAVADPLQAPATAAAALGGRRRLRLRVERLMDPVRRLERPNRVLLPLTAAAVLATALVSPVVLGGDDPKDPDRPPPAPMAPTPPAAPAVPAPPAAPAPPRAPAAPKAMRGESDAERRLEQLARRMEDRARVNQDEIRKLKDEIQAIVAKVRPREEELERLHAEARRVAEEAVRLSADDRRAIEEKARALAEIARPTAEEERELRRLAGEMAREARPAAEEIARITREAMEEAHAELQRTMESVGPELERAREELRRAAQELKRAAEEHRRAADEMGRKPREER